MIVIYMITNLVNGKVYIGSTDNVIDRFDYHKYQLNKGIHHNEHLQRAWNKYGSDSFEFKTLMVCPDTERNHCEQMFIDLYDSQNRDCGYNIRDADFHSIAEETRLKISKANSGENNPNYGKTGYWVNTKRPKHSERMMGNKNAIKNHYSIIKHGFRNKKQLYAVYYHRDYKKHSIDLFKLIDWCLKEYPDEDLEISMEVLDNALLS